MSEILITLLTMVVSFIIMGIIMAITPYITRKNTIFGVMVPEHANDHLTIRKYKKQYVIFSVGLSLIGSLLMFIALWPGLTEEQALNFIVWGGMAIIIIFMIINFGVYYYFHRKVKELKQLYFNVTETASDARVMVSTNFRDSGKPIIVSNTWFIVFGLIIISVTAIAPIIFWDRIPDQVPMNFSFDGTITNFADKSPGVFAIMPIVQLLTLPILVFSNYSIKSAKQNIKPKNPKVSMEQNRAYRYAWSKFMVGIGIGTLLLFTFAQFSMIEVFMDMGVFSILVLAGTGVLLGATLYLAFKYGQGGERYQPKDSEKVETSHQVVDDDNYWKLGMFYYNPNDPAIFIEKRFGIGITFNFARWQTWALIGVTILITILLTVVPFWLTL